MNSGRVLDNEVEEGGVKKRIEDRRSRAGAAAPPRAFLYRRSSILSAAVLFAAVLVSALTTSAGAEPAKPSGDYLIHLPGIAGFHGMDRQLLEGLRDGGFVGEV